jgi:hypothetical protein
MATKMVVARKPAAFTTPPDDETPRALNPAITDRAPDLLIAEKGPAKIPAQTARAKPPPKAKPKPRVQPKAKAKPKSTSQKLSKEDIVRRHLRVGMSVAKIAKSTGYDKKYIRKIKKGKVCCCP